MEKNVLQITPRVEALAELCRQHDKIDSQLYKEFDVKRGLRDLNGEGVLAGLTNISDNITKKDEDGKHVQCDSALY